MHANGKDEYFGRDCPAGMVQIEVVGCPPEARFSVNGWKPVRHAFLEVWVDGQRFRIEVGNFVDGKERRRGLHIIGPPGMAVEATSVNSASIFLPVPPAPDQQGKQAGGGDDAGE